MIVHENAVGNPDTIGRRTALYFTMIGIVVWSCLARAG